MRSSCVERPANMRMVLLRQEDMMLCEGNKAAALLISLFEYWHNIKLEQARKAREHNSIAMRHGHNGYQDESLYQFHTAKQLHDQLMGLVGKDAIAAGLKLLEEKGYITIHRNPNPRYSFDNTKHFLFHPDKVSLDIAKLGLLVSSKPAKRQKGFDRSTDDVSNNGSEIRKTVYRNTEDGLGKSGRTSPELSYETSLEREEYIQSGLENPTAFTEGLEENHAFREEGNSPEGEGIGDIDSPVSTGGSTHGKGKVAHPPYKEIVDYLNEKAGTQFKPESKVTRRYIKARWNEGFRLEDFKKVIDKKVRQWKHKPDMVEYLRPTTLFGTKFEAYLMAAQHKTGWEVE